MKKFISLLIAALIFCTCCLPVFATDADKPEGGADSQSITITYHANNDAYTGTPLAPQTFTGSTVDLIDALSIDGYTFKEWNEKEDGKGTGYTAKQHVSTITKNTDLYAIWEKVETKPAEVKYTLSFDAGEIKKFDDVKLAKDAAIVLPDTAVEGYKFNGWFTDKEFKNASKLKKMPEQDTVLYASYTKLYKLTFDTNNLQKLDVQWYEEGAEIKLPEGKAEGYKFNGWFTDKEYKTKFVATKMPAEDITIYASYTKLYKLSFNTQDLKKIDAMWLEEGAAIVLPSADVENYKFMGWFTDAKYQKAIEKDAKMPKADTVLYGCYAIKLSKLGTILKDIDIEQFVKDSKLSPETFNKLAKSLGFEVKYSVNGKTYTVNDVVNFTDELTAQLKKDIKFGDIAAVDITISLGKDESENLAIYVYNDIEDKEADKPTTTTKDTTKDNTDSKTSSGEKTTDIPDTGAESIAPAVITFLTSIATVGGAVVLKKKKEN